MKWFVNLIKSLARGLGRLSPNCREAGRLQSEALDHKLAPSQRIGLHIHLLLCKWCRRYGRQIAFLRTAARRLDEKNREQPPAQLSAEAREHIKHRLRTSGDKD